jgi:two-component system sensor histidine kinase DesK
MIRAAKKLFPASEGWFPLLLLVNLLIPLYFVLQEPPVKLTLGLLLLGAFVVLYRQLYWTASAAPAMLIAQTAITLTLSAAYHPMFAYVGFLFAYPLSEQKTRVIATISVSFLAGMAAILVMQYQMLGQTLLAAILPPLFGVCVMPFLIRVSAQYKQMANRLQAATAQIERMAQQEERQRIARELHDTLGHTLTLISLKSEVTEKLVHRAPDKAAEEARDIRITARAALKQMRDLVTEMKAVRLADEFAHALELCEAAGIVLTLPEHAAESDAELPLTALQQSILATCFREALTNVVRHSRAARCDVCIDIENGLVRLLVSDNGTGIGKPNAIPAGSNGLAGMRERLALVDGSVELSPGPASGTIVTLTVPRVIRNS